MAAARSLTLIAEAGEEAASAMHNSPLFRRGSAGKRTSLSDDKSRRDSRSPTAQRVAPAAAPLRQREREKRFSGDGARRSTAGDRAPSPALANEGSATPSPKGDAPTDFPAPPPPACRAAAAEADRGRATPGENGATTSSSDDRSPEMPPDNPSPDERGGAARAGLHRPAVFAD